MGNYNRDWEDLGRSIENIVDRAVNSRDYQKLNQTIRQTVERAVDVGGEAVKKAVDSVSASNHTAQQSVKKLYGRTFGKIVGAILKISFGGNLFLLFSMALINGVHSGQALQDPAVAVVLLALIAGGAWMAYSGISTVRMVSRFKVYRRILGQKTQCPLEKLARGVRKNEQFVRKDVWKMIRKGLFLEGHMDREETCLITSNETYRYFEESRLQLEEQQRRNVAEKAQEAAAEAREASVHRDPRVQEVLDRGNAFIAEIRRCNDDIPGEEISNKISHMELIVRQIFERAEAHPEIVPDLKKLMDFYLPMTVKLLNAYADMDAQPIQGETIEGSKREIEATMDTLNAAFEKLLDSVFKDTALDVSSDISVLNTLLAQEGLAEDEFTKMRKQ